MIIQSFCAQNIFFYVLFPLIEKTQRAKNTNHPHLEKWKLKSKKTCPRTRGRKTTIDL